MALGLGSGLWACILPREITNLATNPSMEYGTTGWSALAGGAAIGSSSYKQAFGAWSLQIGHTITSEGAFLNMGTPAAGSYSLSAYVSGTSGHRYRLVAESASGVALGAGSVTSDGGWQPVTALFGLAAGTGLNIVARHIDSANGTFYLDGVQLESGTSPTTYIDGDQPGGTWTASPHTSSSIRSGQYRGGGSVVALADLGLQVDQMIGAGVGPIEVSTQSYAVVDGAEFQRQRAGQRKFTLTAKPLSGTSLGDFHVTRRTLYDAFKPDLVDPQQPVRFLYVGGQGTQFIDAFYASGLELGNMDGPVAEVAGISFVATDPYWYAPIQQGTTLSPQVALGSANYIVKRSPQGAWGTCGIGGTTINTQVTAGPQINALAVGTDNKIIIGGDFGTVGGTVRQCLALYDPVSNTFGTFPSGTINGPVNGVAVIPQGTVYIGGQFSNINGTAGANNLAFWAGNYGTFPSAAVNNTVNSVLYSPAGTLYFGGEFTAFGGTTRPYLGFIVANAFGSLTGGTLDGGVRALTVGPDNKLYIGGHFAEAGGTRAVAVASWNGAFGSLSGGSLAYNLATPDVYALEFAPSGQLAIGGVFGTIQSVANNSITSFNGVSFTPIANGFGPRTLIPIVKSIFIDATGVIIAGGSAMQTANDIPLPDNMAQNSGGAWAPLGIDLPGQGVVNVMLQSQGVLYVAGSFAGAAIAASVGTIVNTGRAQVYPTLRLRNTGAGTVRMNYLINATTNDAIYFNSNMSLLPQEQVTLVLQPGNRSFTSNFRGNVFGQILPTSNLASWSMLPGTNYVSLFCDSGSVDAAFFWNNRGWSIDSGTII